jgi:excinuclease UvrABC nuclease subunit
MSIPAKPGLYLYFAEIRDDLCKIGVSKKPKKRVTQLSTTQRHKAKLIASWPAMSHLEATVHHFFTPQEKGRMV